MKGVCFCFLKYFFGPFLALTIQSFIKYSLPFDQPQHQMLLVAVGLNLLATTCARAASSAPLGFLQTPAAVRPSQRAAIRTFGRRAVLSMAAGEKKYQVVLVRHGESTWNDENRFTGWYDCPLSEKGLAEAKEAGKILKVSMQFFLLPWVPC